MSNWTAEGWPIGNLISYVNNAWRQQIATSGAIEVVAPPPLVGVQHAPGSCQTFTDDPLVAGSTWIKAVHFTELRTCVNDLRSASSLAAATWTDATLTPQVTVIKAVHVNELRAALDAVYVASGSSPPGYGATPVGGVTTILASHVTSMRDAIRAAPAPPPGCTVAVSPYGVLGAPAAGGTGSFDLYAGCQWTAVSTAQWLRPSPASGQGSSGAQTIGYVVDPNPGPPRTAAITIDGVAFTVFQSAESTEPDDLDVDPPMPGPSSGATVPPPPVEGDLLIGVYCYGYAESPYAWAPVVLRLSLWVEGVRINQTALSGIGFVETTLITNIRASLADRQSECRAETPTSSSVSAGTIQGSGPHSIRLTTSSFIPDNWITGLNPFIVYGGDSRDAFVEYETTSRMAQVVDLVNSAISNDSFLAEPARFTGLTQECERTTDANTSSLTGGWDGVLKAEAVNDWIKGAPFKLDWDTDSPDLIQWEYLRLGPGLLNSSIRFVAIGKGRNPLVFLSPYIDYRFEVTLTFGLNRVAYSIEGCHDKFPAFEVFLGGRLVYGQGPTGTVFDLFENCGNIIVGASGVIP